MDDDPNDEIGVPTSILSQRRIPRFPSTTQEFDPRRATGLYATRCTALERALNVHKLPGKSKSKAKGRRGGQHHDDGASAAAMQLEIHGVNEAGDGLEASFAVLDRMVGIMIFAGSRKVLQRVVQRIEGVEGKDGDDDGEEGKAEEEGKDEDGDDEDGEDVPDHEEEVEEEVEDEDEDEQEANDDDDEEKHENEDPTRSQQAFEKNTFRNPKFWLRWRARLASSSSSLHDDFVSGTGYIVFSGNDCARFSGTLNCADASLLLEEAGMKGKRITGRARGRCPLSWADLGPE